MMIVSRSTCRTLVFLLFFIHLTGSWGSTPGVGKQKLRCKEAERQALLKIKEGIYDDEHGFLSSWGEEEEKRECCEWIGIRCGNRSDHVVRLDLSASTFGPDFYYLEGANISSSMVNLSNLKYLDLSGINFYWHQYPIPSFLGTLSKLRYLNLSQTNLWGEIPPQLGNLSSLQYLDLSNTGQRIKNMNWVSHLSSLQLLDLSSMYMSLPDDWVHVVNNLPRLVSLKLSECFLPDVVPPHLSLVNSSRFLAVLDLSSVYFPSASILLWLFNYSHSLVHLDLAGSLPNSSFPEAFGNMASLEYLDLQYNFEGSNIPNSFGNMTALTYLDLSHSNLEGSIPESFGNMTSIAYLDLSGNHLEGSIPESFGNMASLEYLDLKTNMLEGEIPESIWKICALKQFRADNNGLSGQLRFSESSSRCAHFALEFLNLDDNRIVGSLPNFTLYPSLKELHLSSNQLNGNTSKSIGQLSKLEVLDISNNSMADVMSEAHFSELFNLHTLNLSSNSRLVLNMSSDWIPSFHGLESISLRSCKLGPHFPKWILTQKNCTILDVSNTGISDLIPYNFWKSLPNLESLDLSDNEIRGTILDKQRFRGPSRLILKEIDLSSNQLEGSIPLFLLEVVSLNLFKNRFSDLNFLCKVHKSPYLTFLDVSYNQLSGEIPSCWSNMRYLRILILANNKLSGKIPASLGLLRKLQTLHLGNNNLTGGLPSSIQNCTRLIIFDVEANKLSGQIPAWIGKSFAPLVILSLRSNNFNGSIPVELCRLVRLQLLDLSSNDLSSNVPKCLDNITAMKEIGSEDSTIYWPYVGDDPTRFDVPLQFYDERLFLVWKGALQEFTSLGLLKNIDLSSNKLSGEIPREITKLLGLISLNLSRNNLTGKIPQEIGQLKSLDLLDLSNNHLSGRIPSSLSQVDRLNTLDLSSNNLSGKIPTGTQLQTRDAAAYMGNPELCGDPLPKKCPGEEETTIPSGATADDHDDQGEDGFITKGFYISAAVGFIVAFWGVCGTLVFNKMWRYRYFNLLNDADDWLYVTVAVRKAKLLRMIKT